MDLITAAPAAEEVNLLTLYVHIKPSDKIFLYRTKPSESFPQLTNKIISYHSKLYPLEAKLNVRSYLSLYCSYTCHTIGIIEASVAHLCIVLFIFTSTCISKLMMFHLKASIERYDHRFTWLRYNHRFTWLRYRWLHNEQLLDLFKYVYSPRLLMFYVLIYPY